MTMAAPQQQLTRIFMISAGIYILTIAFAAYVIYSVVHDNGK
jgi:hypothetical protein